MYPISGLRYVVGPYMINDPFDLQTVHAWLARWRGPNAPFLSPTFGAGWQLRLNTDPLDAISGPLAALSLDRQTEEDILAFQRNVMHMPFPTGVIRPGDETERRLAAGPQTVASSGAVPRRPPIGVLRVGALPGTPMALPPRNGASALDEADYDDAAKKLSCEPAMVKAFAHVEGKDHGFDSLARPVILFEPTHFAALSGHRDEYRKSYPQLTHKGKKPHLYGTNTQQWEHLQEAYLLSPAAALKATSWGRFQQLGEFYYQTGYGSVEGMVNAMCQSEQAQLDAFVARIQNTGLTEAMQKRVWTALAAGYNGTNYKDYDYDDKLKAAYAMYAKPAQK